MLVTNEVTHDSRVRKEAEALHGQGFRVIVLGLDRGGRAPAIEETPSFTAFHCQEWRLGRWLRNRPEKVLNFWGKGLKAFKYLLFSRGARAEIVHAHDLDALPFGYLAARRCRAKLVYDSHELSTEQWVQGARPGSFTIPVSWLKSLEAFLVRRADAVITVSPSISEELARRYPIQPPLVLRNCALSNPEGEKAFSLRESLNLSQQERIVLHTGDLNPRGRALKELALAFGNLKPDVHLVFLGEGPLEKDLKDLARGQALEARVRFLRPVLPQQLIGTMKGADLAAVLMKVDGSLNNLYSLPNKLFEAIAAGLPVVASDLPEIASIVRSYEIGVLCNPEDPQDIARAIKEALTPYRYATFKANLKRAQEELNWERESQKLKDLYLGHIRTGR
jgi:glycosyltransferase involved in cell wall biosynthesis